MSSLTNNECFICKNELKDTDAVIITDCNHTFHRNCVQECFDTRKKSDCPICNQESAVVNALSRDMTTKITKSMEEIYDPLENTKNEDDFIVVSNSENSIGTNKNDWGCEGCSGSNEKPIKRCRNCGRLRYSLPSIFDDKVDSKESTNNETLPSISSTKTISTSNITKIMTKQDLESLIEHDEQKSIDMKFSYDQTKSFIESDIIVYITDLPLNIDDDIRLANLIHNRVEKFLQITPINVKCYSKLSIGFMYVRDKQIKNHLVENIKRIVLDSIEGTFMISFHDKISFILYIVIDKINEKKDINLPTSDEILNRWMKIYNGEKPRSCNQISIQFPNIYRIVLTSFNDLHAVIFNPDFLINNLFAHVYIGAYCNYIEDLPKSITREKLEKAIQDSIGMKTISSLLLHIELNKQTNNACIIASDIVRKWITKSFLYVDDKPISIKENLTYRLLLYPISEIYEINEIVNQKIFHGQAKIIEQHQDKLILEILNQKIFDECLKFGILRIGNKSILKIENYIGFKDPEEFEIDNEIWYENEMIHYKPDIMQFITDLNHPIFHYKWNADIWLQQFQNTKSQNNIININLKNHLNLSSDQIRHLLQMTVMLNTIGIIRKKNYLINNQQIILNLNSKLKTIIYNHESLLEHSQSIKLITTTTTPYIETNVKVINEDCVIVYENCCKIYKKPLLLNMANATNPGGGYRKGDEAQEENLFRRSDYFRSLDIDLDFIQEEIPERFYCSHNGEIRSLIDITTMYPMDEYGAIYTSGLTFFRKSEDKGYDYMIKPLEDVYSLAIAAYKNPKLDGNMLSPKYAVGMRKKIENLFSIAYHHKHDCLILSAFGCGAFKNPTNHIAKLFHSVIEQYAGFFQTIIFAIINDHNNGQEHNPQGNFKSFKDELDELIFQPILSLNYPNTISGPYRISLDGSIIHDVTIFDLKPCPFGAKCNEMYNSKHIQKYSHPPLCKELCMKDICKQTNDLIHMLSFIHRNPCKYGAQCKDIDNEKHFQEYEHPSYCPNTQNCQDTSENHEKAYRHLPLCKYFQKCSEYRKHIKNHLKTFMKDVQIPVERYVQTE